MLRRLPLIAAILIGISTRAFAVSVFTGRPDDPAAVYLTAQEFGVRSDGTTDDSAAIQAAIDKATATPTGGIVFVPAGRYRLTRTIYVWRGVRVIGYGATRPVFVLAANTPGFQKGIGLMVMFTSAAGRPGSGPPSGSTRVPFPPPGSVPANDTIPDAGPSTFYSAMSNIDFDIGAGNPAAIAIRFHVAQHGYLSHMDFHTGSGLAALTEIGNEAEDLRFYGGRYGILTDNTSPFWQFTLIDSVFDGQREAAIREHMAGLTLVRDTFRNVPTAIDIDPQYPISCGSKTAASRTSAWPWSSSATRRMRRPRWASRMRSVPTCRSLQSFARVAGRNPAPARSTGSGTSTTASSCRPLG